MCNDHRLPSPIVTVTVTATESTKEHSLFSENDFLFCITQIWDIFNCHLNTSNVFSFSHPDISSCTNTKKKNMKHSWMSKSSSSNSNTYPSKKREHERTHLTQTNAPVIYRLKANANTNVKCQFRCKHSLNIHRQQFRDLEYATLVGLTVRRMSLIWKFNLVFGGNLMKWLRYNFR